MIIALHDADFKHFKKYKTFPNYALMKISAYHKSQGDTVEWWNELENDKYDLVYSSKIFDFTPENPNLPPNTIKGGTGYKDIPINQTLPKELDDLFPDYSIYSRCDYAIGYITRGCINNCRHCSVPEKEGKIYPYRDWRELVRADSNKLVLMDNNILACEYGIKQLESMIKSGYKIDLNQGMDANMVTPEIAGLLSRLDWIRFIRFSCDTESKLEAVFKTVEYLGKYGIKPYRLYVYLLVTKDIENAAYRVNELKKIKGINLYAQAEQNGRLGIIPNEEQLEFSQRYIYSRVYKKETWREYCHKRGFEFI